MTTPTVEQNRRRFLAALYAADPARQCQGQMFAFPLTSDGPVRACATGIAAEVFLGLHNPADYHAYADGPEGRNAYDDIKEALGLVTTDEIYVLNDGLNGHDRTFAQVADVLAHRWELS